MNNRLSMQDIIDMLASQHDIPKEDAKKFIVELFNVIELGLTSDELVKIKDFGTFKLTPIQERESVDVNTKEKIVIAPHRRITFIPAPTLKALVNKPFAHFETTPLNDGIVFENVREGVSAEDDDDEDEYVNSNTDVPLSDNTLDALYESADLINIIESTNRDNSTKGNSKSSLQKTTHDNKHEETENTPFSDATHESLPIDSANEKKLKPTSKRSFSPWYIASVIFITFFILFTYKLFYQRNNTPPKQVVEQSEIPKPIKQTPPVIKSTTSYENDESVETIKMEAGKTLRLIALDKYGSREFWVYIYLKNKEKIKNPDVVPVGLELILPCVSEYDIDPNNTESVAKAKKIGDEEMKKFW